MQKSTVLVTGASSGIGYELAKAFAQHGHDLVITARREDRLAELAGSLPSGCRAKVIPADLAKAKGPRRLLADLEEAGITVDILVNNAGVAANGAFQSMTAGDMRQMLQLNVRAVTELTHALLPGMIERGHGRVLNVASVAGFQGVPGMSLYSATKAFVLALTEGLSEDLHGTGVSVTALCPGLTRTEMFHSMNGSVNGLDLAAPFVANARDVALEGYRACMAGEVVRVPGLVNQALVGWMRFQPKWLVRAVSGMVSRSAFGRHD